MRYTTILVLALIGYVTAAPWRCYTNCDGATICIGPAGQPCVGPPCINIPRPNPPCSGAATVATPYSFPCPQSPCTPPPCPCPPPPCDPCPVLK
ncbi:hypothetical protein K1T71_000812 [Dendrolimus kikuchii]|uniref:Uncharacterized protein n=1 Tax=Dendrolimus kikuchii TaxID=765133 RepID=A0ACC1DKP1_9NEOP|nr:hypothetical protein K1T71_000812 [Dendrolimus kikuchii]